MKLIIKDNGDPSVGIPSSHWTIDVPFEKDMFDEEEFKSNLEAFRDAMIIEYQNYCEGKCYADYDFELEARYEDQMLHHREMEEEEGEPVVTVLLKDIVKSDAACEWLGLNPWCVNEGCDGNAKYGMSLRKAKEFGLIK